MPNDELKEKILSKIRSHEVVMRPRVYFTLQVAALVAVTTALLLVSVLILNFILFSIRIEMAEGGPDLGFATFLQFFPWNFLILAIVLFGIVLWLMRQFKIGYTIPVLYLVGGLLGATVITAALVDRTTPFNDHLLRQADEHRLPPPFGDIYRGVHHPHPQTNTIYIRVGTSTE